MRSLQMLISGVCKNRVHYLVLEGSFGHDSLQISKLIFSIRMFSRSKLTCFLRVVRILIFCTPTLVSFLWFSSTRNYCCFRRSRIPSSTSLIWFWTFIRALSVSSLLRIIVRVIWTIILCGCGCRLLLGFCARFRLFIIFLFRGFGFFRWGRLLLSFVISFLWILCCCICRCTYYRSFLFWSFFLWSWSLFFWSWSWGWSRNLLFWDFFLYCSFLFAFCCSSSSLFFCILLFVFIFLGYILVFAIFILRVNIRVINFFDRSFSESS